MEAVRTGQKKFPKGWQWKKFQKGTRTKNFRLRESAQKFTKEYLDEIRVIEKGEKYPKFWLNPISVARSRGFRDHQLREIVGIIKDHVPILEENWHEFFGC
jgi:hypothetical protein